MHLTRMDVSISKKEACLVDPTQAAQKGLQQDLPGQTGTSCFRMAVLSFTLPIPSTCRHPWLK